MPGGISGGPLAADLLYAAAVTSGSGSIFSPLLAYAVAFRETIRGELAGLWNAASVISGDGGYGLMQLTSSHPSDWIDPSANVRYAIATFLYPAYDFWWGEMKFVGSDLVRGIAAEYNAGRGQALAGHAAGDLDTYTTDGYAADVLAQYTRLCAHLSPV